MTMTDPGNYRPAGRRASAAQLARDAALLRVGRARRWVLLGAAGLSAAIAALVSGVAPGRSLSAARANGAPSTTGSSSTGADTSRMPPLASPSELGLQGPDAAPQASQDSAPAAPDPSASDPSASDPSASDPGTAAPAPAPQPSGGGGAA